MVAAGKTLIVRVPKLHAGQRQILAEARRFNVLECGRRYGKTSLGLQLALATILTGAPVAWFAPTYKSLAEQWRDAENIFKQIIVGQNKDTQQMRFVGGGLLDFWSLDNADSGRGRKYKRVIIDEASIVPELQQSWEQTIRATLADLRGDAWLFATPKPLGESEKSATYFHRLFERGQNRYGDWKSWRFATIDNPYIGPDEVEAARRDLPDDVFRQEFEGIPMESGRNVFFRPDTLAALRLGCIDPLVRGELDFRVATDDAGSAYTVTPGKFLAGHTHRRLKLWCSLIEGRPAQGKAYIAFADISLGVGASNSTLRIASVDDRAQVASFTVSDMLPDQFARYSVAICLWFGGDRPCQLGWEANGPDQVFGREVIRCGYYDVLADRRLATTSDTEGAKLGWWSDRDSKAVLLSDLRSAWTGVEYLTREIEAINEAGDYVYYAAGGIGPASMIDEPAGARSSHGDRVIGEGGIVFMLRHAAPARTKEQSVPEGSWAARRAAFDDAQRARELQEDLA